MSKIMDVQIHKRNLKLWLLLIFFCPIILTIVMILQRDKDNSILMSIIIGVIWLLAIIIATNSIKEAKNNPYPFFYLVDYNTLLKYMKSDDEFSFQHNLEASFHFYLYKNSQKIEIQSWHFTDNNQKNIYYYNKEEFNNLDDLVNQRLKGLNSPILIELIDGDNVMLNNYKKEHPELNIIDYIENKHYLDQ